LNIYAIEIRNGMAEKVFIFSNTARIYYWLYIRVCEILTKNVEKQNPYQAFVLQLGAGNS